MTQIDSVKAQEVKARRLHVGDLEPLICERWMTLEVHTVRPLDSVVHARALLEEHRINQLPVIKNNILVGTVTDRDLRDALNTVTPSAKAGMVEPALPTSDEIPVEAVMTTYVNTLSPHSTLVSAALLMRRGRFGSVPIMDGDRLVGIVTRSDILDAFVSRENGRRERAGNPMTAELVQKTEGVW